jgi:hypothetical protein
VPDGSDDPTKPTDPPLVASGMDLEEALTGIAKLYKEISNERKSPPASEGNNPMKDELRRKYIVTAPDAVSSFLKEMFKLEDDGREVEQSAMREAWDLYQRYRVELRHYVGGLVIKDTFDPGAIPNEEQLRKLIERDVG